MSKFKVGDRVVVVGNECRFGGGKAHWLPLGSRVTVVTFNVAGDVGCKDADGLFQFLHPEHIKLVGPPAAKKIVVTTDGKTTTAELFAGKELVKSAEAKCSPSDEFVFETSAALALDRLLDREKKAAPEAPSPQKLNCKVVCVSNHVPDTLTISGFVVGKVYEVKNGRITSDNGYVSMAYETIKSLSRGMGNSFIEFLG